MRNRSLTLMLIALTSYVWPTFAQEPVPVAMAPREGFRCMARNAPDIDPSTLRTSLVNTTLDNYIRAENAKLVDIFGVIPNLVYVDAVNWDNAAASSDPDEVLITGTVYIGIKLLENEFKDKQRGLHAIIGALAHEYGHILQYKFEGATFTDLLQTELHADFMAGYYIAKRSALTPTEVDNFAFSLFLRGDRPTFFGAPDHGGGDQRVAAMLAGYYSKTLEPNDAYNAGRRVALELSPIIDNNTNFEVLGDKEADPEARAQMQENWSQAWQNNSASDPHVEFRVGMQNRGTEPIIVKLITGVLVVIHSDEEEDSEKSSSLTSRVVQRRILPGQTVKVKMDIRSTAQSSVVKTRLAEPRWVVAFERNVAPPSSAEETSVPEIPR
jgi:hypothetical protein